MKRKRETAEIAVIAANAGNARSNWLSIMSRNELSRHEIPATCKIRVIRNIISIETVRQKLAALYEIAPAS